MGNKRADVEITHDLGWNRDFTHVVPRNTVWIGYQGFDYREGEEELPRQKAWCKNCACESANVVAPIWMNCKPAYALKCEKCGEMHHMYVSMYRERYIGHDMPNGGHVNPTRGVNSYRNSMDRKAREKMAEIPKKVEDHMCEMFNMTHEEYHEMKERQAERTRKVHKKIENEWADRRAEWRDEKLQRESDERKELIAKGVLVYKKGIGLVNTETGQIVKL